MKFLQFLQANIKKTIFIAALIAIAIIVAEVISKNAINEDVEQKISYMKEGSLEWALLTGLEVSPDLVALNENSSDSVISKFIQNNEIGYKIGFVFPWGCNVKFDFNGYDFNDYLKYCQENGIEDYTGMSDAFEAYKGSEDKKFDTSVKMKYKLKGGAWVCDYNTSEFMNAASCGTIEAYTDYYNNSIETIQKFIDEVGNEDK